MTSPSLFLLLFLPCQEAKHCKQCGQDAHSCDQAGQQRLPPGRVHFDPGVRRDAVHRGREVGGHVQHALCGLSHTLVEGRAVGVRIQRVFVAAL